MFLFGVLMERLLVQWLLRLDPLYNFLLTFGLTLLLVDLVKRKYGVSGLPYPLPAGLEGSFTVGSVSLSTYQVFAAVFSIAVCLAVWLVLTKTRVGMIVRASTEDAERSRALGINVSRWVTPVFGFGIALAGLAGVLRAPVRLGHRRHGQLLHHHPVRRRRDRRARLDPRRGRRRLPRRARRGLRPGVCRPRSARSSSSCSWRWSSSSGPPGLFGREEAAS